MKGCLPRAHFRHFQREINKYNCLETVVPTQPKWDAPLGTPATSKE
jgi:hypothetical protein